MNIARRLGLLEPLLWMSASIGAAAFAIGGNSLDEPVAMVVGYDVFMVVLCAGTMLGTRTRTAGNSWRTSITCGEWITIAIVLAFLHSLAFTPAVTSTPRRIYRPPPAEQDDAHAAPSDRSPRTQAELRSSTC